MPERSASERESEVVRRCRRVRQELYARFKTPEEMHAWLMSLEKQSGTRHGQARTRRKGTRAPHGRSANGKAVRKT